MLYPLARPVVQAVRGARNRLLNLLDPPVIVLIYHRVTELPADPQLLAVTPENFRAQLGYLKEHFPLLRFEEDWEGVSAPAVVVTFDDGYADNAREALPILEELGVPATFFVSTGNLDTRREYWWDELERLLLAGRPLPPEFRLADPRHGRVWASAGAERLRAMYEELHGLMMWLVPERRDDWLAQLRRWAGADEAGREAYRAMSREELRRLAASPWVTLGAHTVTHTPLAALDAERQRQEIVASRQRLAEETGREIVTFSYPFGRKIHYDRTSLRLCREAGFTRVAANFPGQVHRWSDPMQIPRHLVRNWEPATFAAELKRFWTQ